MLNAVEGLQPGAYFFDVGRRTLEVLELGDFRARAAHLALDQQLAGDAAVAVFFLADLERCLGRLGNRGYRAAQLEAGILGGKMYLGAYALRFESAMANAFVRGERRKTQRDRLRRRKGLVK